MKKERGRMHPINLVLLIMAYIFTGMSITAYDYAAPALYRTAYVIGRNIPLTLVLCLIWLFPVAIDARNSCRTGKGCVRFVPGIVSLFCAFYLWGWAVSCGVHLVLKSQLFAYAISGIVLIFLTPIFTVLPMPRYMIK
ncbi:MAG: hypothetical protein PHT96_02505 [Syntrophorhabdaceae bacterium]|nr:hypothetical protein [Syntrophorhabdaceae bacterium]